MKEYVEANLEVIDINNDDVCELTSLLQGTSGLIILFSPHSFDNTDLHTMECLIMEMEKRLEDFKSMDVRVVCITSELPSTLRHWVETCRIKMEVFSDLSLTAATSIIGTFDLSKYLKRTKGIQLGHDAVMVPKPGVVLVSAGGQILSKYVAPSPDSVDITADYIFQMCRIALSL